MNEGAGTALKIEGVSKGFGDKQVLHDVSLELAQGEIVCILGPSGCGKTTLLNLVAGLLEPDAGRIARPGRVGYVFQEPRLLPWRTVQDNVAFGLKAIHVPPPERARIAQTYLRRLGLADVAGHYPHQLSGGMRQRVALGRALAIDPQVLLLDEPFKSLDILLRIDLLRLLLQEWALKPRSILYVTHDISDAALAGQRCVILSGAPARVQHTLVAERAPDLRRPGDADVQRMEARLYDLLMATEGSHER